MVVVSYPDNSGLRVFKGQVFDLSLSIITLIQPVVVNKRAGEETKVKETVGPLSPHQVLTQQLEAWSSPALLEKPIDLHLQLC